jgi:ABC-type lipoprotein release transport system permease subunit
MLKIAWRNLWRHRTRTWITIAAVALTYALYLVTSGIQEFTYTQMEESAAKAAGGSVLVQGAGYQDSQMNDVLMADGATVLEKVRQSEGVEHAAPRVIVNGLLSTSASSTAVRLLAVKPRVERHFQEIDDYLTEGTFLEGQREDPIVLGSKIVEDLELEMGDRVILTATDPDGEMRRSLFHLSGILHSGSTVTDRALAFTTVEMGQQALGVEDELTQIGVLGPADRFGLSDRLESELGEKFEVLTWDEAMPDLVGFIEMDRRYGDVFAIILFFVVLIAIMNTFLMAVMERVRELGLMSAIGLTPWRVVALVVLETLFLSLVAIAIGLVLGFMGHLLIDTYGLDLSSFYGSDLDMAGVAITDTVIYSEIDAGRWFNISMSVVFMVLLSAAYPAYKAAKLVPAEAMRFYE